MSYTPFVDGERGGADTFNRRFDELVALSGGGGSPVLNKIVDWTTLGGLATSINLSGIASIYSMIHLVALLRCDVAGASASLVVTANNDLTAANYYLRRIAYTATVASNADLGVTGGWTLPGCVPGNTALADYFALVEMTFVGYAQSNVAKMMAYRTHTHTADSAGGTTFGQGGGSWRNVAALSSLQLSASASSFVAGSSYGLYGVL